MLAPHYSFWEVIHHKDPNEAVKILLNRAQEVALEHLDIVLSGKKIR